jgi:hypothetical protein
MDLTCVECSKVYDAPDYCHHGGNPAAGPAYWSDKGALCSPKCSLDHFLKRQATGDPMTKPAPMPGVAGR